LRKLTNKQDKTGDILLYKAGRYILHGPYIG